MAAAMLAIGVLSWWRERRLGGGAEGYWTAHRSLLGWSLGMSLSASMLSVSWSLVYGTELLYRWGPGGLWLLAVPWLLVLALFGALAPRLRRFAAFSQGGLFGSLCGRSMRWLSGGVLVAVFTAWCGAGIAAAAGQEFPEPAALSQPVLGALLERLMPAGMRLVLLGGLAAVALSTVSTAANVVALTIARDAALRPHRITYRRLTR